VRGLSLKTLGEMTGQKYQSVARHETGENQITIAQLEAYARALRIKPEELLKNSMRVHPMMRGLLDLFESLPADEQERFVRMGYAFVEPNVRYLAPPKPTASRRKPAAEAAPFADRNRRAHK
jgi:transcriptional regulator with XRE-family HTH domain